MRLETRYAREALEFAVGAAFALRPSTEAELFELRCIAELLTIRLRAWVDAQYTPPAEDPHGLG